MNNFKIEGVLEEAHLLVSLERYVEMKQIIEPLLTEVYSMYDSRKGLQADRAARALISVMEQHKKVVGIQQTASATLFLIFKENSADITPALKRRVVETILTSGLIIAYLSYVVRCLIIFYIQAWKVLVIKK